MDEGNTLPKKKKRISSRAKGHALERSVMHKFIERGWTKCKTARNESKTVDDSGVDLCFTEPFQIQCKAVENLGPLHPILKRMPKTDTTLNVVWHKRNREGNIVALTEEDFFKIVDMLIESGSLQKELTKNF